MEKAEGKGFRRLRGELRAYWATVFLDYAQRLSFPACRDFAQRLVAEEAALARRRAAEAARQLREVKNARR